MISGLAYLFWAPGVIISDGRHDLGHNGIWLQHGWLGADEWFHRQQRDNEIARFRNPAAIQALAARLRALHVTDVFPHLAPCSLAGELVAHDPNQTERFLDAFDGFRVMPWVGGVLDKHTATESASWRDEFAANIAGLLQQHPRLAGIHINIEPWPESDENLLKTLETIRAALPTDKLLSVAAYPPPSIWHPHREVHWSSDYFIQVAKRCDQVAVMMYDTSLRSDKFYRSLMADWTESLLLNAGDTQVLLGVPVYDDAGVGYHHPEIENLSNALPGIHAGLLRFDTLPEQYQGVAIYCEWELDADDEQLWSEAFMKR